jgi:hypothetical protein
MMVKIKLSHHLQLVSFAIRNPGTIQGGTTDCEHGTVDGVTNQQASRRKRDAMTRGHGHGHVLRNRLRIPIIRASSGFKVQTLLGEGPGLVEESSCDLASNQNALRVGTGDPLVGQASIRYTHGNGECSRKKRWNGSRNNVL